MHFTEQHIEELLGAFPRLRRMPSVGTDQPGKRAAALLVGTIEVEMKPTGHPALRDAYRLRIEVPGGPTEDLPEVYEVGGRIPRELNNHVNDAGNLCLGSPVRLRTKVGKSPTLLDFLEICVVPFLYAQSWREQGNPGFPFQELPHFGEGLIDDYQRLLKVSGREAVFRVLVALGARRRVANKCLCPCGCGLRLGRCAYRVHLQSLREAATRPFYRSEAAKFRAMNPVSSTAKIRSFFARRRIMRRVRNGFS